MIHYLKTFVFLGGLLSVGLLLVRALLAPDVRGWIGHRFWVIVPIVAVGLFGPNVWTYYGAVLAAMLLLPRSRMEAAGLYIFLALLLPLVSYDVLIGSMYVMRMEGHTAAALGLLAAFRFPAATRESTGASRAVTTLVALFIVMQIIVEARVSNTSATTVLRAAVTATLGLGVPYLLIATAADRGSDLRRPLFYLVAAGVILSVVAAFEMIRHWPLYQTVESHLGVKSGLSRTLALRGGLLRAPGPFTESTTFGVFLAIAMIATAAMPSVFRSRGSYYAAIALGMLGCFATLSRNAWIGAVLGLVMVALYRGRIGKSLGAGILVAVVAATLIVASPDTGVTASLLGKGDTSAAGTATYRQDLFEKSIPLVLSKPWTGTPYDRVREVMRLDLTSGRISVDYVNSYLYYAVVLGFPGLFIFFVFIIAPIGLLVSNRKPLVANHESYSVVTGLFAAQVSLSFMIIGTSFFERVPTFAILLMAMTRGMFTKRDASDLSPAIGSRTAALPERLVIDPLNPRVMPDTVRA